MLELKHIAANSKQIIEALKVKNFDAKALIESILYTDTKRKKSLQSLEEKQAKMNSLSKEIGLLFREGKATEANEKKAQTAQFKEDIAKLNEEANSYVKKLEELLIQLPNTPHSSVPEGNSDADNKIEKDCPNVPEPTSKMQPHWELLSKYDKRDMKRCCHQLW